MDKAKRKKLWSLIRRMGGAKPLPHTYPQWEPPMDDPTAPIEEYVETWCGRMRIVRNRRRKRLLQRRGVPMMKLPSGEGWAWFVDLSP